MDWLLRSPATSITPFRIFFGLAYAPTNVVPGLDECALLFGGFRTSTGIELNDTWVWDDDDWLEILTGTDTPPIRQSAPLAFDPVNNEFVLFGGYHTVGGNLPMRGDTWVFNGTIWIERFPAHSPPARGGHAMAFDSTHGYVVLFGGYDYDTGTPFDDTWIWDGTDWTEILTGTDTPSARGAEICLVDDPPFGTMLFSGGQPPFVADTWRFNGTIWTDVTPGTSPPAVNTPMLAAPSGSWPFSSVFFGGITSFGPPLLYNNTTWGWDGAAWADLAPVTTPTGSRGFQKQMCGNPTTVSPSHPGVLMIDGDLSTTTMDTWTWAVAEPVAASIRHTFGLGQ